MLIRALFVAATLLLGACAGAETSSQKSANIAVIDYTAQPYVKLQHPEWAKDAVIYQINTRQFTEEGTFNAAKDELPRLKDLGVDILWLMPIHPIGEVNRKGTLGSPYSVKDYYGVNPELGTLEEFKAFVAAAHAQDMKVIIDWVANHSAWDNPLVEQHPEWYVTDWKGDFVPTPWTDWADIIDLDFDQPGLRKYMTEALVYWVKDVGIDGYRADVAGFVPLDFWVEVRRQLDEIKPVFMLAEWQQRDLHAEAFDATYGWAWKEAAQDVAAGRGDAGRLRGFYSEDLLTWPDDAYRMLYTSNHDQNAWEGTPYEFYGDAYKTMMALQFVSRGIPLIYNGQEAGNTKRLEFFEKDTIAWRDSGMNTHIKALIELKTENEALWNGAAGGMTIPVSTDNPGQILSFAREKNGNSVVAIFNMTDRPASFELTDGPVQGGDYNTITNDAVHSDMSALKFGENKTLAPWGYLILTRSN